MPPQQPSSPSTLPSGPGGTQDPEYNFIFDDQKKRNRRFSLGPSGGNLTKITLLVVIVGVVVGGGIILLSSVLGPKGVNKSQLVDIMARDQEINRVSTLIANEPGNTDPGALNLAATTSSALLSNEVQLLVYLKQAHIKVTNHDLAAYQNKNIDTQLQAAVQTNNLSATYYAYLKIHLANYSSTLQKIYNGSPANVKPLLKSGFDSAQTILSSGQVATATSE